MRKTMILIAGMAMLSASSVMATVQNMGTGGEKGSYFKMGNDIAEYCRPALSADSLEVLVEPGGSSANLAGMMTKKYSYGMVQIDDLMYQAKVNPNKVNRSTFNVITAMHVEPVHLLIPVGYQPKGEKKSWFASLLGKDDQPVKVDINLLRGQQVGAWGGSMLSAKALSSFFQLNLDVVEIKASTTGDMPVVVTAGYPSKVVEEYLATGKYRLVSIDSNMVTQQAPFYSRELLNYTINGKVQSIETVGVRALLIGKTFRNAERNKTATELATCIESSLADLADDPNTSPNWASVYEFVEKGNMVDWVYFPLNK
jgi:TRAP-type uncharacterized transport system substrate-binding protein